MSESDEVWKDIELIPYHQAAWPFHQVSNHGRIRALPGARVKQRTITEIELRILTLRDNGYVMIRLPSKWFFVHHLVLNQFVGPCPDGQECRHLNSNRSDNRWPENLEWGTPEENYEDRIRHGTDNRGEQNGSAKLTKSQVLEIKNRVGSWGIVTELAKEFGVHPTMISKIRNGRNWKTV